MEPVTITALAKFLPMAAKGAKPVAQGLAGATSLVGGLIQRNQAMKQLPPAVDPNVKSAMTRLNAKIRAIEVGTKPAAPSVNRFAVRSGTALMGAINKADSTAGALAAQLALQGMQARLAMEGQLTTLSRYNADRSAQLALLKYSKKSADAENAIQQGEDMLMHSIAGGTKPGKKGEGNALLSILNQVPTRTEVTEG